MTQQECVDFATHFVETSPGNLISPEIAISGASVGLRMYDAPLIGYASADDPLFDALRNPEAIGPHFLLPRDWLPGAKTVLSIFLPFTQSVREGNRTDKREPGEGWLHARFEGQAFLLALSRAMQAHLAEAGHAAVLPALDPRFFSQSQTAKKPEITSLLFTSNWSERHIAYVCGLGTFGLSKGLITEKGVAGRLTSLITDLELPPTPRAYEGLYDYCTMCGKCVVNCPAEAISKEKGKEHPPCCAFLDGTIERYAPRYGCGKCQVSVPCEFRIPAAKFRRA